MTIDRIEVAVGSLAFGGFIVSGTNTSRRSCKMRRPPATSTFAYSFGPGPLTPAVKLLIISNVVVFIASRFIDVLRLRLGFMPQDVLTHGYIWQPFTYMFVHDGIFHILFNMLALWMFGVELERMWGSRYFTKFYLVSGVGAAVDQRWLVVRTVRSLQQVYYIQTVGASGAVYGVLLAYAMFFPHRPIYMYFVFPIPARYFVMIIGAISLLSSIDGSGGGIAHTHAPRRSGGGLSVSQGRQANSPHV